MSSGLFRNLARVFAYHLIDDMTGRIEKAVGLDSTAAVALMNIGNRPIDSIGVLAERVGLSHSAAVRVVDRLAEAHLVVRKRSDSDWRQARLKLTAAGKRAFQKALLACDQAVDQLIQPLSAAERCVLESILRKIVGGAVRDVAHAWMLCRYCDHAVCEEDTCPVGSAIPAPAAQGRQAS